jgi:hypothetical protein
MCSVRKKNNSFYNVNIFEQKSQNRVQIVIVNNQVKRQRDGTEQLKQLFKLHHHGSSTALLGNFAVALLHF